MANLHFPDRQRRKFLLLPVNLSAGAVHLFFLLLLYFADQLFLLFEKLLFLLKEPLSQTDRLRLFGIFECRELSLLLLFQQSKLLADMCKTVCQDTQLFFQPSLFTRDTFTSVYPLFNLRDIQLFISFLLFTGLLQLFVQLFDIGYDLYFLLLVFIRQFAQLHFRLSQLFLLLGKMSFTKGKFFAGKTISKVQFV